MLLIDWPCARIYRFSAGLARLSRKCCRREERPACEEGWSRIRSEREFLVGFCGGRDQVVFIRPMTIVSCKGFSELSAAERGAILSLLDDDDPAVERLLVDRLVSFGRPALEWLLPLLPSASPVMRHRVGAVKTRIDRDQFESEFLSFCVGSEDEMDLEDGLWRFVLVEYPAISLKGYCALIDSFAEVLSERLSGRTSGEAVFAIVNQYLFEELNFSGNENEYYDPENSFLNRVIDRRTGIPITLSALLLLIAQRLDLPVVGIGMPGHFLCRYQTSREEFYIDAFNRGRLLKKSECIQFLKETSFGYRSEYLHPASPRAILLRVCQNLWQIHSQNEDLQAAERVQRYVTALSRRR